MGSRMVVERFPIRPNVAGALKVGIVGHRASVEKATLVKSITGLLK